MFDKFKLNKKYVNIGIITLIIGVILLFVYQISRHSDQIFIVIKQTFFNFTSVISPILYAFIISYILYRPLLFIERWISKLLNKISKKKWSEKRIRLISLLLLTFLIIWAISTLINSIFPPLIQNLQTLTAAWPNFQTILQELIDWISPYFKNIHITNEQVEQVATYLTGLLTALLGGIFSKGTGVVTNVAGLVINFIATLILTFYFLKDKNELFAVIDRLATVTLSPSFKLKLKNFLRDIHIIFGNFIVGQLLDSLIVGIASTILLLIIGHPFALLIGVIAGITNIIPYIGPIIGAGLALVLGLFTSVKLGILGFLLLIIYQQVDGNIIQPKILGDSVGLAPVWIFMAILIGGNYLGAFGMILAVPIVALAKLYIDRRFLKLKTDNRFTNNEAKQ